MRELTWLTGFDDRAFLVDYVLGMRTLFWADPAPRFIPRVVEPSALLLSFGMILVPTTPKLFSALNRVVMKHWMLLLGKSLQPNLLINLKMARASHLRRCSKNMAVCVFYLGSQSGSSMVGLMMRLAVTPIMVLVVSRIIFVATNSPIALLTSIFILDLCVMC